MPLILVRHAKALSRKKALLQGVPDSERALTPKGRAAFLMHAQKNKKIFDDTDLFVTSPFVRARQTLEILLHALNVTATPVQVLKKITPADPVETFVKWLQTREEQKIVVVGHEPFISQFLIHQTSGLWVPQKIKKGDLVILNHPKRKLKIEIISTD